MDISKYAINNVVNININVLAGQSATSLSSASYASGKSLFGKSSTEIRSDSASTRTIASEIGGATVLLSAGNNILVRGSSVVSDTQTTLVAGTAKPNSGNITLESNTNTNTASNFKETKSSGFSLTDSGFFIGSAQNSTDRKAQGSSATASTVASLGGNVTIVATGTYKQVGSDVMTPAGDITIAAKQVLIQEARETAAEQTETKSKQSGLTVAIGSPVVSALQAVEGAVDTQTQAKGSRMQALAAVNTGLAAKGAVDAIQAAGDPKAVGLTIAVSAGTSKSQSNTASSANTAKSSTVKAGGNITITASGADAKLGDPTQQRSDITIQGSQIQASKTATLDAQDNLNLLASQNTTQQTSSSSNSSSSVGVTFGIGAGTTGVGFNIAASKGKGAGAGNEVTYNNTLIEGNQVNLRSGKDTTLIGAVVKGTTVNANIAGNLKIESLQDTSVYHETSSNTGGSLSISAAGIPTGGSITAGKTKIDSNLQSVGQQSAIRAGDGGFNVNVQGNTTLTGGQITSTQKAVDDYKNSFNNGTKNADGTLQTGTGQLTITDISNTASYNATGASVTVGVGTELASSGAGAGQATGNANSTTQSAITGVAGNKQARTGDLEAGLQPIFNLEAVKLDVATQIEITKKFGQNASKAVGDYAGGKLKEAKTKNEEAAQADQAGNTALASQLRAEAAALDATWGEGQPGRIALHTLVGALGGGVGGAVGAATSQAVIPILGDKIAQLDIPVELKQVLVQVAAVAVGAATGGTSGVASAVNATSQNYLSHIRPGMLRLSEKEQYERAVEECKTSPAACQTRDSLAQLSAQRDRELQQACSGATPELCNYKAREATAMGNVVTGSNGGVVIAVSTSPGAIRNLNPATIGKPTDPRTGTLHDTLARSTAEALLLESGNQVALAIVGAALKAVGVTTQTVKSYFASTGVTISDDAAARIANNFYREGSIADPSKPMSAMGPWRPAATMSGREADSLAISSLPKDANITGRSSAEALNAQAIKDGKLAPFVPGSQIIEITITQPTQYVRLYGGGSGQVGSWVMKADDIKGLSAEQIASKFGLPQAPTMIGDVTVPAGTRINASVANGISPKEAQGIYTGGNGGGGGVQFQIIDRYNNSWFSNGRALK